VQLLADHPCEEIRASTWRIRNDYADVLRRIVLGGLGKTRERQAQEEKRNETQRSQRYAKAAKKAIENSQRNQVKEAVNADSRKAE
jgi:hypothetical protein